MSVVSFRDMWICAFVWLFCDVFWIAFHLNDYTPSWLQLQPSFHSEWTLFFFLAVMWIFNRRSVPRHNRLGGE